MIVYVGFVKTPSIDGGLSEPKFFSKERDQANAWVKGINDAYGSCKLYRLNDVTGEIEEINNDTT